MSLFTLKTIGDSTICDQCPVRSSNLEILSAHIVCAQENGTVVQWQTPTKAYLGELSLSALRCPSCPVSEKDASLIVAEVVSGLLGASAGVPIPDTSPVHLMSQSILHTVSHSKSLEEKLRKEEDSQQQQRRHLIPRLQNELELFIEDSRLRKLAPLFQKGWKKLHPMPEKTRELIRTAFLEESRQPKQKLPAVDRKNMHKIVPRSIRERNDAELPEKKKKQVQIHGPCMSH